MRGKEEEYQVALGGGLPDQVALGGGLPGQVIPSGELPHHEPPHHEPRVFARTFGEFDLFVDGRCIPFRNPKEKELMAILVDRAGGTVTAEEAIARLWEGEPFDGRVKARYRKLVLRTRKRLAQYGVDSLVVSQWGVHSLDCAHLTCDYFELLSGNQDYEARWGGRYLSRYSWAEPTLASLVARFCGAPLW
jgi:hypothetical protein